MQSAEIFVVCTGFKAPAKIDPRFFSPKFIFKQNEADVFDLVSGQNINSLKKIFESKKKSKLTRDGKMVQHRKIKMEEFLQVDNPFAVFALYNEITLGEEMEEIKKKVKTLDDLAILVKDLKLLGKRDVSRILKWREKVRIQRKQEKKSKIEEEKQEEKINSDQELEKEENALKHEEQIMLKKKKKQEKFLKKQKKKNNIQYSC